MSIFILGTDRRAVSRGALGEHALPSLIERILFSKRSRDQIVRGTNASRAMGGSAAPPGDAKFGAKGALILTSSSPQDESVRLADKGLLDPPSISPLFIFKT
jgi:hypothetical protein